MWLSFQRPWKSIVEPVTNEEINSFVVLTGPNGSGKSQLINAIEAAAIQCDNFPAHQGDGSVRVFRLSELMAQVEPPQALSSHRERWTAPAQQILSLIQSGKQQGLGPHSPEQFEQFVTTNVRQNFNLSDGAFQRLVGHFEKPLFEYTLEDIKVALPLQPERIDPFQLSVGQVFGTYFTRRRSNSFERFLEGEGEPHEDYLTDDDFLARYGPPPWETLNEALRVIGLDYVFGEPKGTSDSVPYLPELRHRQEDVPLQIEDLSTGERTLLVVALSLYTAGSSDSTFLQLPQVLLLDEPDASLHPSMIQSLIRVLHDVLVLKHGVRVIMTTHSPTTVALAPPEALYSMSRSGPSRLHKVSPDEALSALAVGIPTLSVRVDSRRTVFVEEKIDVACYEQMYQALKGYLPADFSLQFVASGSGSSTTPENSGSAQEVRRLVDVLRAGGNDRVFGIVDHDNRNIENSAVKVNTERYTIENFVLDPLLVATLLLREGFVDNSDLNLSAETRHYHLSEHHAQRLLDFVTHRLGFDPGDTEVVNYVGGFSLSVSRGFLTTKGKELERHYEETFQPLKGLRGGLVRSTATLAAGDRPIFIPSSVRELFERLVSP